MIEYRTAGERFRTVAEGRTTWHSFSFEAHYDPANVGFGSLVAHNDEHLPPGAGYAAHPHADVEIVTFVVTGALRHSSEVGSGLVRAGQVQRLSAGSGVTHSEVADGPAGVRFVQAWVRPDETGTAPDYASAEVVRQQGWTCLAGDGGAVPIRSRGTALHVADLVAGDRLALPGAELLHVFVTAGQVMLGERLLEDGDAARLTGEGGRLVVAEGAGQVLAWGFR